MTTMLLGRETELALVEGILDGLPGRGAALLLTGDAGIGKTALVSAASARAAARGMTVLSTTGVESEVDLPWSGLQHLLEPVLDGMTALPGPQRDALLAALDVRDGHRPDPYLAALGVLGLLGDAAERAPVLVVAEEVHWLDRPTSAALAFVARRLESDALVLLLTARGDPPRVLRDAGILTRRLEPLDAAAASALLDEHAPDLPKTLRASVLEQAAGNPLALVELPTQAAADDGALVLPGWLPLTTRLERAFTVRVADLAVTTRATLLVAALQDRAEVAETLAAASEVTAERVTLDALSPAVAAGLIDVGEGGVRFRHPLMRSAVRQAASAGTRQAAHRALAVVLAETPERSIWHRVAAGTGPDATLAGELEELATRTYRRGSVVSAVDTLARAAALTPDALGRGRRLLVASEFALEIGRTDLVRRLLAEAEELDLPEAEADRRQWVRDMADRNPLDADQIDALLERAERLAAGGDVARASQALLTVAFRLWWARPTRRTRERVVDACERLLVHEPVTGTVVLALVDPLGHGSQVVERLARLDLDRTPPEALRLAAVAAAIVGSFERSAEFASTAVGGLRAKGRYGLLAPALVSHAWATVFLGDWGTGLAVADEARRVSLETGQPLWALSATAAAAALEGLRGDLDGAMARAEDAERLLPRRGADGMLALVRFARGLAHLSAHRSAEALTELTLVLDIDDPGHSPFVACWAVADLAEAVAAAGRDGASHEPVPSMSRTAVDMGSPWLTAAVAYARQLAAGDDDEAAVHHQAVVRAAGSPPLLRARSQLAHGGWLRRRGGIADARAALRAARDTFDAVGATEAGDRARRELRAAGEASRGHVEDARSVLTPQELQIAELVAQGLSTREVGQMLYLSHRTVGSHLYRIFPKLGVVSRGELRTALGGAEAA